MLKITLLLIALVIIAFLIVVSMRPDEMRVSRTATMSAPADAVFAQVNDLGKWNAWSPWAKMDPNAKATFEGPTAGVGAKMRWESENVQVGVGSMTISESRPNEMVHLNLVFEKPFKGTNTSEFTFKPIGNQTEVTWSMHGPQNFVAKAMGLIFDCDKMVGGQFEKGLDSIKQIVETKV